MASYAVRKVYPTREHTLTYLHIIEEKKAYTVRYTSAVTWERNHVTSNAIFLKKQNKMLVGRKTLRLYMPMTRHFFFRTRHEAKKHLKLDGKIVDVDGGKIQRKQARQSTSTQQCVND